MHRSDYTAARRLQQQIPLPIADVLALLKQHSSAQAAIAAYRAAHGNKKQHQRRHQKCGFKKFHLFPFLIYPKL